MLHDIETVRAGYAKSLGNASVPSAQRHFCLTITSKVYKQIETLLVPSKLSKSLTIDFVPRVTGPPLGQE